MLGRVCYTNLSPALLQSLDIPTNRIAIAKDRAEHDARQDTWGADAAFRRSQEDFSVAASADAPAEASDKLDEQIATLKAQIKAGKRAARNLWDYYVYTSSDCSRVTSSSRGGSVVDNDWTRLQNARAMDQPVSDEEDQLEALQSQRR